MRPAASEACDSVCTQLIDVDADLRLEIAREVFGRAALGRPLRVANLLLHLILADAVGRFLPACARRPWRPSRSRWPSDRAAVRDRPPSARARPCAGRPSAPAPIAIGAGIGQVVARPRRSLSARARSPRPAAARPGRRARRGRPASAAAGAAPRAAARRRQPPGPARCRSPLLAARRIASAASRSWRAVLARSCRF